MRKRWTWRWLLVFALTGTSTVIVRQLLFDWLGTPPEAWQRFLVMFLIYPFLLVLFKKLLIQADSAER